MEMEKVFTFTGNSYEEAIIALEKLKEFVMKKPENGKVYRFAYVNIDDDHGVENTISDGGRFNTERTSEKMKKLFEDSKEMLERNKNLKHF